MDDPIEVRAGTRSYQVLVGNGLLEEIGTRIRGMSFGRPGSRCAVITDDRVAALYADRTLSSLEAAGFAPCVVAVPAGEGSKSMSTVARVADQLIEAELDRHGFVVALGGGVVGDLAGFIASIYYRGIPLVQIPTTIVAQVDSSVGGKTGVNTAAGKNLLGTFYPPSAVFVDIGTLSTLPTREYNEGFAEIIKHGVIRDAALLRRLVSLQREDTKSLADIIRRNLEIKAEIVAADEYERHGLRALLNFGHTVGHGIEHAAGYGEFLHGEAISLGMVAAGRLSMAKAGLADGDFAEIVNLLERFRLPTILPKGLGSDRILDSLRRDKKFEAGSIRFVLTPRLGDAYVSEPGQVTWDDLRTTVEQLRTDPRSAC